MNTAEPFLEKYPNLGEALQRQKRANLKNILPQDERLGLIRGELAAVLATDGDLGYVADAVYPEGTTPKEWVEFGQRGLRYLGIGNEVNLFMGRILAAVVRRFDDEKKREFLLELASDANHIGEAFLITGPAFELTDFKGQAILSMIRTAYERAGRSGYMHGLWNCVASFARRSPKEGLVIVEAVLACDPKERLGGLLAVILGISRENLDNDQSSVEALDKRLQDDRDFGGKALYIESWARTAGEVTESIGKSLKTHVPKQQGPEKTAWCLVLQAVVLSTPESWRWVFSEMSDLAKEKLSPDDAILLFDAAVECSKKPAVDDTGPREWENLVMAFLGPSQESRRFRESFQSLTSWIGESAGPRATDLLRRISPIFGDQWLALIDQHQCDYFILQLQANGQHEWVATALCLGNTSTERQLGLRVFMRSGAARFDSQLLERANPRKIELLFLEIMRGFFEPPSLARLHAALAGRMRAIGGDLLAEFDEEQRLQALNAHGYRETLTKTVPEDVGFKKLLSDTEALLTKLEEVRKRPSLGIRIPGHRKASEDFMRRFSREVEESAEKHSVFAALLPKVNILYGLRWRSFGEDGKLSPVQELQKTEVSSELPRMEYAHSEMLQWRRYGASKRIKEIEKEA